MEREADTFTTQNDRSEAQIASPAHQFADSVNLSSPQTNNAVRDMERAGKQSSESILSTWNDFQITTGATTGTDKDPTITRDWCGSGTGSPGSGKCTSGLKATTESSAVAAAAAAAAGSQKETKPQVEPQPAQAPQQNQWHQENRWHLFRRNR
jgi:hypothetical protein